MQLQQHHVQLARAAARGGATPGQQAAHRRQQLRPHTRVVAAADLLAAQRIRQR
jgi:hypothetical protein